MQGIVCLLPSSRCDKVWQLLVRLILPLIDGFVTNRGLLMGIKPQIVPCGV